MSFFGPICGLIEQDLNNTTKVGQTARLEPPSGTAIAYIARMLCPLETGPVLGGIEVAEKPYC